METAYGVRVVVRQASAAVMVIRGGASHAARWQASVGMAMAKSEWSFEAHSGQRRRRGARRDGACAMCALQASVAGYDRLSEKAAVRYVDAE